MSRKPDPRDYVTRIDPALTRKGGLLQALSSPKTAAEPEPELEAEP